MTQSKNTEKKRPMEDFSLKRRYMEAKNAPTPAQAFIREVAEVTHKSEITVRMWLQGRQTPDELTCTTLAAHFGTTSEVLFPKDDSKNN